MKYYVERAFRRNMWTKCVGLLARPIFRQLAREADPARYNGACLLGLQGCVIKSHGGAKQTAFANAVEVAIRQAQSNIPEKIAHHLAQYLVKES